MGIFGPILCIVSRRSQVYPLAIIALKTSVFGDVLHSVRFACLSSLIL